MGKKVRGEFKTGTGKSVCERAGTDGLMEGEDNRR